MSASQAEVPASQADMSTSQVEDCIPQNAHVPIQVVYPDDCVGDRTRQSKRNIVEECSAFKPEENENDSEADSDFDPKRSEERRVGKECRIGCRSRWSPYH